MKSERSFHPVIFKQWLAATHFLQNLGGKILAVQQKTELRLVERRIIQQRQNYILRLMMQQRCQLFTRGGASAVAIWIVTRHPIPSRPAPQPRQAKPAICRFARAVPFPSARHPFVYRKSANARSCRRSWPAKTHYCEDLSD